jgi:hypothetical protein
MPHPTCCSSAYFVSLGHEQMCYAAKRQHVEEPTKNSVIEALCHSTMDSKIYVEFVGG